MSESYRDLPLDLWALILNNLPHHTNLEPLSLVCKQFLKLTNQLRPKLIVTNALILTHNDISSLINKRFPNIDSIDFSNYGFDIKGLLLSIASNCELEKLSEIDLCNVEKIPIKGLIELGSKIKVLKCRNIRVLRDKDLVGIGNSLPLLEELDISCPRNDHYLNMMGSGGGSEMAISDFGIRFLSLNLKNLRRINVSGNHFVTDRSLVCLSENCEFLEGVDVVDCTLVTAKGVLFLLQNSVHLNSISASGIETGHGRLGSEDMSFAGRRLYSLDLRESFISEEFMCMLVEACVDLKRLSLFYCTGFKVSSLALLLRKCRTLQHLALCSLHCITDVYIVRLFPYLHNLVSLELSSISDRLTLNTLHTVARRCPSLEFVQMECHGLGITDLHFDSVKYGHIKSLNLSKSCNLDDTFFIGIALACPNLERIDLSYCDVTEKCLAAILDTCHEIRILSIKGCQMNSIGQGLVLPKLEVLDAANSAINDEGLAQIAMRCPRLEKLGLARCVRVTYIGVKEVVVTCQILKEINLYYCEKVYCVNIVSQMISTRPSLVKIVPPSPISLSNSENGFYLQHGCQILEGSKCEVPKIWE
ncbi:hypothetical protein Leryth_001375 [Lithospermum erythrorhizon]|nr:hypothetical protein Leryth_001375 [Lithospermum erythrorhizon]